MSFENINIHLLFSYEGIGDSAIMVFYYLQNMIYMYQSCIISSYKSRDEAAQMQTPANYVMLYLKAKTKGFISLQMVNLQRVK